MDDIHPESGWDRRRRVLLGEYERVALELFAAQGFKDVTVDDIAAVAGVSARTLFRYFPTKEDFLLATPRRGAAAVIEMLAALPPSPTPLETAWKALRELLSRNLPDVELLNLWRRAASGAPEVVHRVRGERVQGLMDALTDFAAKSLEADPRTDVRPRLLAGIIAGAELAQVEALSRSDLTTQEVLAAMDGAIARVALIG